MRHLPGYLDAQQKGRSLNLDRNSARQEQGSDRSRSERKKPVAYAALGHDFFSSIQLPARAVSVTLHETASD
jgi:hypothetical protein